MILYNTGKSLLVNLLDYVNHKTTCQVCVVICKYWGIVPWENKTRY